MLEIVFLKYFLFLEKIVVYIIIYYMDMVLCFSELWNIFLIFNLFLYL